jgi:hypothetical protein
VYRGFVKGAKDLIKECKRALGPNDKTADVATRSKLKKIEATDVDYLNARQVTECFDNAIILVVDDKRPASLAVAAVAHLSLARSELARIGHLYDVAIRTEGL